MILTERQKNLLQFLSAEESYIPTKILANYFNVSVRTIRYDLEKIEYFFGGKNLKITKKPKKGIKIINKKQLFKILENDCINNKVVLLSNEKRIFASIIYILFANNYITLDELVQILNISKSTVINVIKQANLQLKPFNILIKGKQNYGYKFEGMESNIRKYIEQKIIPFIVEKNIKSEMIQYLPVKNKEEIDNYLNGLENLFDIKISSDENNIFKFKILFFILRNIQGKVIEKDIQKIKIYKTTEIYNKVEKFYRNIIKLYDIKYREEEKVYLISILIESNILNLRSSSDNSLLVENESKIIDVVAEMVNYCYENIKINEKEVEVLVSDLIFHLKETLKREKLKIKTKNIILDQIKVKFGDIMFIAQKMACIFENHYKIKLSEDEIGFITMYICKAIENSKKNLVKNVLVVCNTGRGAAKLLATRIKNNIPEINIYKITSILDLNIDKKDFENIDLIISTVPLNKIKKKNIVVSPIITSYEISTIREYLYLKNDTLLNSNYKLSLESEIVTLLKEYLNEKEILEVSEATMNILKKYSSKPIYYSEKLNVNFSEYTAMILIEFGEMISKIYKNDITSIEFKKILGVFIHIIMAIPRWQCKDFVTEQNIKLYKEKDLEKYILIKNSLDSISKAYNISIKETEIIPIFRYLM